MPHDPKHRSRAITDGPDRAPARAMFKAIGLKPQGRLSFWATKAAWNFMRWRVSRLERSAA